jgi:hypothetical protein
MNLDACAANHSWLRGHADLGEEPMGRGPPLPARQCPRRRRLLVSPPIPADRTQPKLSPDRRPRVRPPASCRAHPPGGPPLHGDRHGIQVDGTLPLTERQPRIG